MMPAAPASRTASIARATSAGREDEVGRDPHQRARADRRVDHLAREARADELGDRRRCRLGRRDGADDAVDLGSRHAAPVRGEAERRPAPHDLAAPHEIVEQGLGEVAVGRGAEPAEGVEGRRAHVAGVGCPPRPGRPAWKLAQPFPHGRADARADPVVDPPAAGGLRSLDGVETGEDDGGRRRGRRRARRAASDGSSARVARSRRARRSSASPPGRRGGAGSSTIPPATVSRRPDSRRTNRSPTSRTSGAESRMRANAPSGGSEPAP